MRVRRKINKPSTVKEVLRIVDGFLASSKISGEQQERLWAVLTALRGPDEAGMAKYKRGSTANIRTAALPRTAKSQNVPVIFGKGLEVALPYNSNSSDHFVRHAKMAAWALGLPIRTLKV